VGPGPRRGSGAGQRPSEPTTVPTPGQQQKAQATPVQASRQKIVVTGGAGYLGFSLGSSLAKSGTSVILLDLRRPQWELCPGTEFVQADVRNAEALHRTFEGVDCVFHVASYGMSGAEQLQKEQIESINVGGTKLVIDVSLTPSGGSVLPVLEQHTDHYSRTKAIADQLILMANGMPLPGGGSLRTCVLRPPGIYGPEEQRHLPRVAVRCSSLRLKAREEPVNEVHGHNVSLGSVPQVGHPQFWENSCSWGYSSQAWYPWRRHGVTTPERQRKLLPCSDKRFFMFRFGDRRTRMNWVHVRNLVQAHVLAAEALTAAKGHVAVSLLQCPPSLPPRLQGGPERATVMEYLHLALRPICSLPPLLTRSEVRSVAVTHTFQIAKARAQLGYVPDKFSFADAVEQYVQSTAGRTRGSTARTLLRLLLGLLLFLGLLVLALRFLGLQPSVV
ncbi:hypothetical protein Celaphus_00006998, partial [Cervus elaphus hippelaphus]